MKTFRFIGLALFAILLCLSACSSGGDDPIEPTPKPEVTKSEITIDSGIISNGLSFADDGGEQTISFTTNENWTLNVASTTSGATWCTASATSGTKGSASVKFTVTENTDYEDRSVSVTIKSGTVSKTFTITQKSADALLVTTNKYEIAQEGGTIEIEVKANIDYKMEISEKAKEWIKESSSRALTTYKHKLDIAMNEDAEKREGEITFKSGDKVETVNVYQAGGAIILLSQDEYIVSNAGETISVEIKSNVEYGVQMPDVDWITNEASSRGMSSHKLKYAVAPNENYDSRSTFIVFFDKNSSLKDTLKVAQAQKDAIVVAKNEYVVESTAGDLKFEVNTNVDFEVSSSVDWIKQNTESRGLEAKPLSFAIEENISEEAREGMIVMSSGELKQEIKVIQKAKPFFSLSETEFKISSVGGEFEVKVSTNGEYSITMPGVDWLTENKGRVTSAYTHTFTVSANDIYDARESEIAFTHKETNKIIKVKILQDQKDVIVASERNISIANEGGIVEVKVTANVDFKVQIPSDVTWINQTDSRALTEKNVYFRVAENTNEESRSAKITFINENSQIDESVTIVQAGAVKAGYANGVVTIAKAGSMKSLLGSDYLNITSLKVIGPINGDDIYNLRQMLGGDNFSETNWGKLSEIDLSEATIVEGGGYYYGNYYTQNDKLGDYMFHCCENLQNITLPDYAILIGCEAFSGCTNLSTITIGELVSSIENSAFSCCEKLSSIIIPDAVTTIGEKTFSGCKLLASVVIGKNITTINKSAFEFCSSLSSIYISDLSAWCNIDFIYDRANPLYNGGKLYLENKIISNLVIPDGIVNIKDYAFYGCSSIEQVEINNSVKTIGVHAFGSCKTLTSVTIGSSVNSIGQSAFAVCDALTSITIPNAVTTIGRFAFSPCKSLTSVTIGDGMTTIGGEMFYGCHALTSITIGKNVTSIVDAAFQSTSIYEFYSNATVPPSFDDYTFYGSIKDGAILYVPKDCKIKYESTRWSNLFTNIEEIH